MGYKEKYEEALERAKAFELPEYRSIMESVFPELAETKSTLSEEDEENMNNVLYILNQLKGTSSYEEDDIVERTINWIKSLKDRLCSSNEYDKDMLGAIAYCIKNNRPLEKEHISWLEKQGSTVLSNSSNIGKDNQKPTDKVEPTFKAGDWIIRSAKGFKHNKYLVTEVKDYYVCEDLKGRRGTFTFNDVHKNFKLWDISDAKNGDVLVWDNSKCIALFKNIFDEDSFYSYGFVGHYTNIFELGLRYHDIEGAHPATKEQRDLLFQKMHESGYEWDENKKELKKIEQNVSWSEEDERNWQGVIDEIQANKNSAPCYDLETYDRFLNWLRTLKQRLE